MRSLVCGSLRRSTNSHEWSDSRRGGSSAEPRTGRPRCNSAIRTSRTRDKVGTYRWYNHHRLPDHYGGGDITIRLHGNDDDTARRFNRTENVRPIPPADPDFPRLYKRRNDAESINRALDDTLWLRRAHSIGHRRQHLNLITHALGVNALALHRHHRRSADPPLSTAA